MGVTNSKYIPPSDLDSTAKSEVFGGEKPSLDLIAQKLKEGHFQRVVVVCGAGISVSAGIPDFRTPGTGLYDNLQSYGLPEDEPTAIFDIEFFADNPKPFSKLASEMYPRPLANGSLKYKPTLTHFFLRLLHQKGVLRRVYTQNIDCLERASGLPTSALVECHGSFSGGHCIRCKQACDPLWLREQFFAGAVPTCTTPATDGLTGEATTCGGYCKPDITFFGENLPERFHKLHERDTNAADLLIVMGTSLQVQPVSTLPSLVDNFCPRLLLNREPCGVFGAGSMPSFLPDTGFRFFQEDNYRDIFSPGDCDDSVTRLCELAGWSDELHALAKSFTAQSATEYAASADAAYDAQAEERADMKRATLAGEVAVPRAGPVGSVPLNVTPEHLAALAEQFDPEEMEALTDMLMGGGTDLSKDYAARDLVDTDDEDGGAAEGEAENEEPELDDEAAAMFTEDEIKKEEELASELNSISFELENDKE